LRKKPVKYEEEYFQEDPMKRPISIYLLVFLLIFLALGGLYGGISMLTDPSGRTLLMDEVLPLLPVPNYLLPGLFLTTVMGLFPLLVTFGIIWYPDWEWAHSLSAWSKHYWAWTGSIALGSMLVIWLAIQGYMIGFRWPIQYVTLINGILILLAAMIPNIRRYFRS
jgi:hypothetical protein